MEPVTHLLTGACLSRLGFNRKTALATAAMVIAAEIPDIDVVVYFVDPVSGFAHHRGFTHSLIGIPFDALLTLGILKLYWSWRRRRKPLPTGRSLEAWEQPRWGLLFSFCCLATASHLLLDFTNNYGLRPFTPFYGKWYSWDIVFIVEPLMLGALLIGLVAPAFARLIGEEIASRSARRPPGGRGGAIFALIFILALWGLRDYQHRRAVAGLNSLMYQNQEPVRVSAYPYWINPFQWFGVVETKDFFALVPVDSAAGEIDPQGRMRIRYKPPETPVTLAAKGSYLGQVYLDWAQYPLLEVEQPGTAGADYTVRLFDLRFAYPERRGHPLGAAVVLNPKLQVDDEYFERTLRAARVGN